MVHNKLSFATSDGFRTVAGSSSIAAINDNGLVQPQKLSSLKHKENYSKTNGVFVRMNIELKSQQKQMCSISHKNHSNRLIIK